MKSLSRFLLLGLSLIAVASSAFAAEATALQTTLKAKAPKETNPWSGGIEYSLSSDQNQQTSRKTTSHGLGFSAGYRFNSAFSASLGTGVQWQADGNNIQKKEDNPSWSDLSIGLGHSGKITRDLKYSLSVSDSLPTGYNSRTEGVKNIFGFSGGLSNYFFDKKLSLSGSASASFISQTYEYSVTTGESNTDSSYGAGASLSYKVLDGFSITTGYSLYSFHMINGEQNLSRNATSVSARHSNKLFSSFLSYSIGNYSKNDGYRFLYVEDTRQMISVGVGFDI